MTAQNLAEHIGDGDMTATLRREKRERRHSRTRSLIPSTSASASAGAKDGSAKNRRSGFMALLCGLNKTEKT